MKQQLSRMLFVVLVAVLGVSVAVSQPQTKSAAKSSQASAASADLFGHQQCEQGTVGRAAGNRREVRPEDHRLPPVCQENGSRAEEDHPASNLQQDRRHDHRQTEVVSLEQGGCALAAYKSTHSPAQPDKFGARHFLNTSRSCFIFQGAFLQDRVLGFMLFSD
jgi:hypothetical protein